MQSTEPSATTTSCPVSHGTAPQPSGCPVDHGTAGQVGATRVFSTSILISAIRCSLAYVLFPWLLPALGLAGGVGPGIGVAISTIAIGFNVASIRRFHRSGHPWRWQITALNLAVICMLSVLMVRDLAELI